MQTKKNQTLCMSFETARMAPQKCFELGVQSGQSRFSWKRLRALSCDPANDLQS